MDKNIVITIARQYGSGGRTIAQMLSERLGIHYYDKELLRLASEDSGINEDLFRNADEKIKNTKLFKIAHSVYHGELIPPESEDFTSMENLFNYQAKVIRDLAEKESCVIVGRCADYILKDRDDVIKVFIYSDMDTAIRNFVDMYGGNEKDARRIIEKVDKERSEYYHHYTGEYWENAKNYNLCLDTSKMSYEKCVEIIKGYIEIIDK